ASPSRKRPPPRKCATPPSTWRSRPPERCCASRSARAVVRPWSTRRSRSCRAVCTEDFPQTKIAGYLAAPVARRGLFLVFSCPPPSSGPARGRIQEGESHTSDLSDFRSEIGMHFAGCSPPPLSSPEDGGGRMTRRRTAHQIG